MKKTKWAKGITLDKAYDLGFRIGMRRTLDFLAEQQVIEPSFISYLLEEKYEEEITSKKDL
jgi:hypothetical protein